MRPPGRLRIVTAAACAASLLVACAAVPARPPEVPAAQADLVAALRDGGHVIFLRHATTDTTIPAGGDDHRDDCARQRNLTRFGREDARALGAVLRALDVPIGEVLASPYCRTLDTARQAFGDAQPDDRLLPLAEPRERLRALLEPPATGNRVLVGHASTMAELLDVHLDEGEAAVLAPGPDGEPRLVGRLSTASLTTD